MYIFRTALTLNSTVNSVVALNNGATADNVTWLPVGPTTLAANSVFKGNILGESAAITVGDNTTLLNGRVLTAAAVTLDSTVNSIVALNNGATADNVSWLPVGPTTLAANSVFKGNILGQSAAITVGDNTTLLNGRVLTAAAVTLRNNQITK